MFHHTSTYRLQICPNRERIFGLLPEIIYTNQKKQRSNATMQIRKVLKSSP